MKTIARLRQSQVRCSLQRDVEEVDSITYFPQTVLVPAGVAATKSTRSNWMEIAASWSPLWRLTYRTAAAYQQSGNHLLHQWGRGQHFLLYWLTHSPPPPVTGTLLSIWVKAPQWENEIVEVISPQYTWELLVSTGGGVHGRTEEFREDSVLWRGKGQAKDEYSSVIGWKIIYCRSPTPCGSTKTPGIKADFHLRGHTCRVLKDFILKMSDCWQSNRHVCSCAVKVLQTATNCWWCIPSDEYTTDRSTLSQCSLERCLCFPKVA